MDIIYYSDAKIPSKEANSIHIMKMCQAFSKNGCSVELVAPNTSDIIKNTEPYSFYGVSKIFNITKIKLLNIKGKAYFYAYSAAKYISKRKPTFAYGRSINIAYFLTKHKKISFGLEMHQSINNKLQNIFFKKIIKSDNFKFLVVISNNLKKYFIENYNIDEDKIVVAHDGADIYDKRAEKNDIVLKGNNKNMQIGYVGQLYKGKGMEIISQLAEKCPNCNFHIVGGKDEDILYWKEITKKSKNIFFYGFVPHAQTPLYCELFDIVLAPYKNKVLGVSDKNNTSNDISKWMSPLKLFEYMSYGKTIICSDLPVLREIIRDKENGVMCDCEDINSWINAIDYCRDKKIRHLLGQSAKKEFENKYTWDSRANKILKTISR